MARTISQNDENILALFSGPLYNFVHRFLGFTERGSDHVLLANGSSRYPSGAVGMHGAVFLRLPHLGFGKRGPMRNRLHHSRVLA